MDPKTQAQDPAKPVLEANGHDAIRDLLSKSCLTEGRREDQVRTRDLAGAYERSYDQHPDVNERLSNAVLPVVGDTLVLYDRPGQTATVLAISDSMRSMTVVTSDGLTLDVPFKYATKAVRMEDRQTGRMVTRNVLNIGEVLRDQQAAAAVVADPVQFTTTPYGERRATTPSPSMPGTIRESRTEAAVPTPSTPESGMDRVRTHPRFRRFFPESAPAPAAPARTEECGKMRPAKKTLRKEDLATARTQVQEQLTSAATNLRATLRASLASRLLR